MNDTQKFTSLALAALIASSIATATFAQGRDRAAATYYYAPPIPKIDADAVRLQLTPNAVGLKPKYGIASDSVELPFGMNYNAGSKSLLMPIDEKNEWGIGLNLNLNSTRALDLTPNSGLGLQPKRTPGLMLQKRF